jgi:hypothetical protein
MAALGVPGARRGPLHTHEAIGEWVATDDRRVVGLRCRGSIGGAAELLWQPAALLLPAAGVAAVVVLMAASHREH